MRGADHPPETPMASVRLVMPTAGELRDVADLCDRLRVWLRASAGSVVVCDVAQITNPDLGAVDALARLQLVARRRGCEMWLRHSSGELRDLLSLSGLRDALPCEEPSGLEARRQSERGEEARGVEEEGDPADPPS